MRFWYGCLSGARCRSYPCCLANATTVPKSHNLLSYWNPAWLYLSSTCLPSCPGKEALNRCLFTFWTQTYTHAHPFSGPLSGTTQVGWYQKKHSPNHTILIIKHPLSTSSIFLSILVVQFTCLTVFFHNLCPGPLGLLLGLEPFT